MKAHDHETLSLLRVVGRNEGTCFSMCLVSGGRAVLCGVTRGFGGATEVRMERVAAATAEPLHVYRGHTSPITALTEYDAGVFASSSRDKTVRLWSAERESAMSVLTGHASAVNDAVSLGDHAVLTGSDDCTAIVWDARASTPAARITTTDAVTCVASLRSGHMAAGLRGGAVEVWELRAGRHVTTLANHSAAVTGLVQLSDGRLCSASHDKVVAVTELIERRCVGLIDVPTMLNRACGCQDGRIAVAGDDGRAYVVWVDAALSSARL